MVLESLGHPIRLERKPQEMFLLAFAYTSIAILLSMWVFPEYAGLTMVFFTVMAAIPLMIKMIVLEEKKLFVRPAIEDHRETLMLFVFLFLGMVAAYTFFFSVLPEAMITKLFNVQISTISSVNQRIAENVSGQFFGKCVPGDRRTGYTKH